MRTCAVTVTFSLLSSFLLIVSLRVLAQRTHCTGFELLLCQLFTGNVFLGNVVLSLFHQSFRPVKERHIPEFSVGEFPCGWPLFANKNPIMNEDSLCTFQRSQNQVLQLDVISYAILLIKNKSFRLECIPCLHAQRVLYSSIHLCF